VAKRRNTWRRHTLEIVNPLAVQSSHSNLNSCASTAQKLGDFFYLRGSFDLLFHSLKILAHGISSL
jgi:hypothetical protein